ncbi:DUF4166 domain-containing protein [uncultured Microbacterium sp.]|uniref:DUF4166 domain-containing protein n=1 Tax=uncultured Microbacterium sp. TaxID=191216 RepID=UPI00263385BD|nr:DUF4166 domain-containing protein [uncultured Microbacterium sp.]
MSRGSSVFLHALGADAEKLAPEVLAYASGPPDGMIGVGDGVFAVAGSPWRWMLRLAAPFVGPGLLVPRHEPDVPFTIIERPAADPRGQPRLAASRTLRFRGGLERFDDVLRAGRAPRTLVNVVGDDGRLEILLEASVTDDGALRLTTRSSRVRVFGRAIRLPRALGIDGVVENGYDERRARGTIIARMRNPLVGTLMEYRGWFRYEHRRAPEQTGASQYE